MCDVFVLQLIPFASVDPVQIGGLTYTLFHFRNLDHLRQLQLKVPDCVVIQRPVGMEPEVSASCF